MSIDTYKSFYQRWSSCVDILTVYIAEAHFVERDENGKIVAGWPIGSQYNYPQHKSLEDRLTMAQKLVSDYDWPIPTVVDTMDNAFNGVYAVWPDRAYLIYENTILYKARVNDDGTRPDLWTNEIEALLLPQEEE